jgi:outer membrane protein
MSRPFMILTAAAMIAATTAVSGDAGAKDKGDILIRLRGIAVVPQESGDTTPFAGEAEISNSGFPELDATYFFTDNIAAELIASVARHTAKWTGGSGIGLGGDVGLGSFWILPPTLTLQYHFMPKSRWSPYVGAGINYTVFFAVDKGDNPVVQSVDYSNNVGAALQIGIDYAIDERWSVNLDIKKLFLATDVKVGTPLGVIRGDPIRVDPWIFGVGIGYRF